MKNRGYWSSARLKAMRDKHLPAAATVGEALQRGGHAVAKERTLRAQFQRAFGGARPGDFLSRPKPGDEVVPEADNIARLVRLVRPGPQSLEQICDGMSMAPGDVRRLIDRAIEQGTTIRIDQNGLRFAGLDPLPPKSIVFAKAQKELCFGVISDTHFGSRYHRGDELRDFIGLAYAAGVRDILDCGDGLDGHGNSYKGHEYDLEVLGIERQTQARLNGLPQFDGLNYHYIDGNHDAAFWKLTGQETGVAVERAARAAGRTDLHYLGADTATVYYGGDEPGRGLRIHMRHPDGGTAYALSYKLQQYIGGIQSGNKPQIVLSGHHHRYVQFLLRNVHAFEVGCFQGQTPYQARKGITPALGGLIFRVKVADDFSVRALSAQFFPYYGEEVARS